MVICPDCERENPDGAKLCEFCYTPLAIEGESLTNSSSSKLLALEEDFTPLAREVEALAENTSESKMIPVEGKEVESSSIPPENPESENQPSLDQIKNTTTKLQTQAACLLHVQTNTKVELPQNLAVIHIGKPNPQVPPDIDISGFPHSQFVSRVHADIRVETDAFYIEDVGSSNGTYINHIPLPTGDRHRLRPGDRIALGKEDKVSFIFQLSEQ